MNFYFPNILIFQCCIIGMKSLLITDGFSVFDRLRLFMNERVGKQIIYTGC